MILAGLAVLLYIPSTWILGYISQRNLRGDYAQESAAVLAEDKTTLEKLQGAADAEKIMKLAENFQSHLQDGQTIAQLEIPKIGVDDIVVEGSSDSDLHKGPGHMENTPLPGMEGNFPVAGDRVLYGGPFLHLNDLQNGDQIIIHTPYANFTYTVSNKHITQPEDTSVLQSHGKEEITLITCDPIWDTSHRLIITGEISSEAVRTS